MCCTLLAGSLVSRMQKGTNIVHQVSDHKCGLGHLSKLLKGGDQAKVGGPLHDIVKEVQHELLVLV